jgi:hypothetical protein
MNINGVKFASAKIWAALEQALGARVARIISFPPSAAHTDQITVAYIPTQWPMKPEEIIEIDEMATKSFIMYTGQHPVVFALRGESLSLLPTTSLGKLS